MHKVGAALVVTLASAAQLAGCSSSAKGITSLPSEKTLSSLTSQERRQFCEDRFHYLSSRVSADDRKKIDCAVAAEKVQGVDGSSPDKAQAACEQVYETCVGVPAKEPSSACDDFPKGAADCAATVGDVNTCAEAQADALEKLAGDADSACKSTASPSKDPTSQTPKDCVRVQRMCPKLFDEPALDRTKP